MCASPLHRYIIYEHNRSGGAVKTHQRVKQAMRSMDIFHRVEQAHMHTNTYMLTRTGIERTNAH